MIKIKIKEYLSDVESIVKEKTICLFGVCVYKFIFETYATRYVDEFRTKSEDEPTLGI